MVRAIYYDGLTAKARDVRLSADGDMLVVAGDGVDRRDTIGAVQVMEAIGTTPRVLRFVGGASCEVADRAELAALLGDLGVGESPVTRWDRSWPVVLMALGFIVVLAVAGYRWGLPWMARVTADRLPASALDTLSKQIEGVLDRTAFTPTQLPGRRRAAILNAFDRLRLPAGARTRLAVEFRKSDVVGANAMALPSGRIFVTDELVEMTGDDMVIIAVLAHEAGHVDKRHGLRKIIQSTVVGGLITWYVGDVSAIGAAAPTALLQAKYSRDLEREADAYAAEMLERSGLHASLLADALDALEKAHEGRGPTGPLAYLSSHPATAERIAWIRAYHR